MCIDGAGREVTVSGVTGACKLDSEGSTSHGHKQKDKGRGGRKKKVCIICGTRWDRDNNLI
jgi:hypothetical protein